MTDDLRMPHALPEVPSLNSAHTAQVEICEHCNGTGRKIYPIVAFDSEGLYYQAQGDQLRVRLPLPQREDK